MDTTAVSGPGIELKGTVSISTFPNRAAVSSGLRPVVWTPSLNRTIREGRSAGIRVAANSSAAERSVVSSPGAEAGGASAGSKSLHDQRLAGEAHFRDALGIYPADGFGKTVAWRAGSHAC